jgi:hypothetical protein
MANLLVTGPGTVARLGQLYLALQGVLALAWWVMLLVAPDTRRHFLAPAAPDITLLAFLIPDVVLFAGAALLAAYGLARGAAWAWPVLCLHAGAAAYAALYCIGLTVLTRGGGWLGAVLMAPSLVVPPWLAWRLRPGGRGA